MSASPDALALFRSVLKTPADDLPRLVFADWLQDTGEPHNVAWAEYLRLRTPSKGQYALTDELEKLALGVKAQLVLPAAVFVRHFGLVLELLPPNNVTVRLGDFLPHWLAIRFVPIAFSHSYRIVPLHVTKEVLCVASATRMEPDVVDCLRRSFRCELVQVRATASEIRACRSRCYTPAPASGAFVSVIRTGG